MQSKLYLARPLCGILRALDRVLTPGMFYRALLPFVLLLLALEGPRAIPWRERLAKHLNRILEFLPDRLRAPKWRRRCQCKDWEHLEAARAAGRPVILAICHFGPIELIGHWLRARGVPAAIMIAGRAHARSGIRRMKDQLLLFPEIPNAVYLDQMRTAIDLLGQGVVLIIALDAASQKPLEVEAGGATYRLATGALRLASSRQAALLPCAITNLTPWRFQIEFGPPVPSEYLGTPADLPAAGRHLLATLLPVFARHPEQYSAEQAGHFVIRTSFSRA